ncbi:m-phase inducer phosphatase [Elasticomyces elasticus]|nr:m-phase inducer phosphatase [Elasticomyces elasticus]
MTFSGSQAFGANSFNFKDLSMKRSHTGTDYFSLRHRGSSPTASLAADLSSNFHIDQSPQLPTPRRSLFQTSLLQPHSNQDRLATPPIDLDGATTPPIPSSSPSGCDMMDMSPLPHKPAYSFITRITVHSPTPEPTPDDHGMVSQSELPSAPVVDAPVITQIPERRKPTFTRPSLLKTKGFSTNTVSLKTNGQESSQPPPFHFGSGFSNMCSSSIPTIAECYTESPSTETPSLAPAPTLLPAVTIPTRQRQSSISSLTRSNGSPITGVRKSMPARPPPRKQFRRSQSMFQHPAEVTMQERKECDLTMSQHSAMDIDDAYQLKLPHFLEADKPGSLPRINQETMIDVLNGAYNSSFDKILVVDCRFEYEFNGGHIDGAVNHNDRDSLAKQLFVEAAPPKTLLILHCEFSELRAPTMAQHIRSKDRSVNDYQYPKLTFPEMYILDGGYSRFFVNYGSRCYPHNYIAMDKDGHEAACDKGMVKAKQRTKLSRAHTFAFGQHSDQMEDSPTATGRLGARSRSTFDMGADIRQGIGQNLARRLASY